MPIDEDRWEDATVSKSVTLSAQEFLEDNYPEAYTLDEITQNILPNDAENQVHESVKNHITRRLDTVSAAGIVETRVVQEADRQVPYYRAVKE